MPPSCATTMPQRHSTTASPCGLRRSMKLFLADCNNDQHKYRDAKNDENKIAVAEITGSKVSLSFISPRCQICQILVAQSRNRRLHLLGLDVRRFQGFLGGWRGQEIPHSLKVVLTNLRCRHHLLLQVGGRNHVALRQQIAWN